MTDRIEFELDVVQRLTRIEEKMDNQITRVDKICIDVKVLEDKELAADGERRMLKKVVAVIGGSIGIISTIIGIMVAIGKV